MVAGTIEHVIVLMMENRSFDHMLGFLDHPNPAFPRLTEQEANPWEPTRPPQTVSRDAKPKLCLDPAHNHADVMLQLYGRSDVAEAPPRSGPVTNSGFAISFEQVGIRKKDKRGFGPGIMACQHPDNLPNLAMLAREFAVCTRWFCSVPGETWPNRHFAHAGTSDGEVNIDPRFFDNDTLFDRLTENDLDWGIYHEGIPQVVAFRRLWDIRAGRRFHDHSELVWAIKHDGLPTYAFVEPDHLWPFSDSQHPSNNTKNGNDFSRGDKLIGRIYEVLASNPDVFEKTIFLVTYDEHGGFYDREAPPADRAFEDKPSEECFPFDLLGPRVPAVIVSPWIARGTVDSTLYDHASIPATVRTLFMPLADTLSSREAVVETFQRNLTLNEPRRGADLPPLPHSHEPIEGLATLAGAGEPPDIDELSEFDHSLLWLTRRVRAQLTLEGAVVRDFRLSPELERVTAAVADSPASSLPMIIEQRQVAAMLQTRSRPDVRVRIDGERPVMRLSSNIASDAAAASLVHKFFAAENRMGSVRVYGHKKILLKIRADAVVELHDREAVITSCPLTSSQLADVIRLYQNGQLDEVRHALKQ